MEKLLGNILWMILEKGVQTISFVILKVKPGQTATLNDAIHFLDIKTAESILDLLKNISNEDFIIGELRYDHYFKMVSNAPCFPKLTLYYE